MKNEFRGTPLRGSVRYKSRGSKQTFAGQGRGRRDRERERERERDEGDDGEKSSRAFVANDDHRRLGEQSARRNRRRRDE